MRLRPLVHRRLRAQEGQVRDDVFFAEILELHDRLCHAAVAPDAMSQHTGDGPVRSGAESGLVIRGQIRGEDCAKGSGNSWLPESGGISPRASRGQSAFGR